jgi:hypothetical protein
MPRLLACLALLLLSCDDDGGGPRRGPAPPITHDEAVATVDRVVGDVCACRDAGCAARALDGMNQLFERIRELGERAGEPFADRLEPTLRGAMAEIHRCTVALRHPGGETVETVRADMARYRDRTCACSDRACLDQLRLERDLVYRSHYQVGVPDDDVEFERLQMEADHCARRARGDDPDRDLDTGVAECAAYFARCAAAPGVPPAALRGTFESLASDWRDRAGREREVVIDECLRTTCPIWDGEGTVTSRP